VNSKVTFFATILLFAFSSTHSYAAEQFSGFEKVQAYSEIYLWYAENQCDQSIYELPERNEQQGAVDCTSVYDQVTPHRDNLNWMTISEPLVFAVRYRVSLADGTQHSYKLRHEFSFDKSLNITGVVPDGYRIDRSSEALDDFTTPKARWSALSLIYRWISWRSGGVASADDIEQFVVSDLNIHVDGQVLATYADVDSWLTSIEYIDQTFEIDRVAFKASNQGVQVSLELQWTGVNAMGEREIAKILQTFTIVNEQGRPKIQGIDEQFILPDFDLSTQIEC